MENELSSKVLNKSAQIKRNMIKKNKRKLVKTYGKEAERVVIGKAINAAKKAVEMEENTHKTRIKELVRKSLMQEMDVEVGADRYEDEQDLSQASALMDRLESLLKGFDWYYYMSDDNRSFLAGSLYDKKIGSVVKQLVDLGYGEDAKTLYNQYAPDDKLKMKEAISFSKEYDNNPALKGKQKKLPDALQKSIIKKSKGEIKEDWGGSDQYAMNQSIHRDLGNPTEFPGLSQIMSAAEEAVDFYWDEWPEYKTDREGLIMHAAQMYANKMFPEFMAGMRKMFAPMNEDLDLGHEDNEPHMIKGELYQIGKYSMALYSIMDELEERGGEIDLPAWWQSKITTAKTMISSAKHYLEFELAEPKVDAFIDDMTGKPSMMEEKKKAEDKEGLKYALATNLQKYGRPQSKPSDKPAKLTKSLEKGREKYVKKLKKHIKEEELVDKVSEGFLDRLKAQTKGAGAFVGTGLGNIGRSFMGKDLKNPKLEAGMAKLGQKAKTLEKELADVVNDIDKLFPQTSLNKAPKELQQTIDAYKKLLSQTNQANSAIAAGKVFAQEEPTSQPTSQPTSTPTSTPKSTPARDEKGRFTSTKTSTSTSSLNPISTNYEVTTDTYTYKGKDYPIQIDKKTKEKFFKHEDGRIMDIASIEKFSQAKKKTGSIAEKLAKKLKSE
jgi:hypothetical protein